MQKVAFVGQAMPRVKRDPHDWPTLNNWLFGIGVTQSDIRKYFFYTALVDYFPGAIKGGGHLVPTLAEIAKERPRLAKDLKKFAPHIVVPIGSLSIAYCLQQPRSPLVDVIGKTFEVDPYGLLGKKLQVIPLPHPSGASTWRHVPGNRLLLESALANLKMAI